MGRLKDYLVISPVEKQTRLDSQQLVQHLCAQLHSTAPTRGSYPNSFGPRNSCSIREEFARPSPMKHLAAPVQSHLQQFTLLRPVFLDELFQHHRTQLHPVNCQRRSLLGDVHRVASPKHVESEGVHHGTRGLERIPQPWNGGDGGSPALGQAERVPRMLDSLVWKRDSCGRETHKHMS
jgi:hypothetical protein